MGSYTDYLISKYSCGVKQGEIWYAIYISAEEFEDFENAPDVQKGFKDFKSNTIGSETTK
jgi:hypothetical protein